MKLKLGLHRTGAFAGSAFAQTQGVSKGEIVIGTMQDLSGPDRARSPSSWSPA